MKLEERKTYHDNGALMKHYFHLNGERHGEYKSYYDNGQLEYHHFYLNDGLCGEFKIYERGYRLKYHCFYSNSRRCDFPFLPPKPPRLPIFKSNRTRYQTLEI